MDKEVECGEIYYYHKLEYILLSVFSRVSNCDHPLLELGAFDSKSSIFIYNTATNQNRDFIIVDLYKEVSNKDDFIQNVVNTRLKNINNQLDNFSIVVDDVSNIDYNSIGASFITYDCFTYGLPEKLVSYIKNMPKKSIFVLYNGSIGYQPDIVADVMQLVQDNSLFMIAATVNLIFFTNDPSFRNNVFNLLEGDEEWELCKQLGNPYYVDGRNKFMRFRVSSRQISMVKKYNSLRV